ncbi:hypothetical protein KSS87_000696 [Heliosperma pusillum]|nr:hypothetical protein KSS87_000696 [Heliosperma pusillum]
MGNVNGREDGIPGIEDDEDDVDIDTDADADIDAASSAAPPPPPLPMALSPTSLHSPLLFTPQLPVAPIQKPDELHILNPSWMPPTWPHEELSCEQGIPTMITWTHGAKEVAVEGSWDNWNSRKPLQRSGKDFTLMKVLSSGVYQYRFIVDGMWRYAPDLPCSQDDSGNYYNVLDLQEYVPEDTESISGFEAPLSPDYSYNNVELSLEDLGKEPPIVPPHLSMTLLNVPSPPPPLTRPQHVVLNHLYMHKGKSGPAVVALGSTDRFKAKYVTLVLYKCI